MSKGFRIFALSVAAVLIVACGGGTKLGGSNVADITPTLNSMTPNSAAVGSGPLTLVIKGSDMLAGVQVLWNGDPRVVQEIDASTIHAQITAADINVGGAVPVTLKNPNGKISNALTFTVGNPNPVPTITALVPNSVPAGVGAFGMKVTGTGFVAGGGGLQQSKVFWNGIERQTLFISATELSAVVNASDVAAAGTAQVTVVNAAPGGGASAAALFTIN